MATFSQRISKTRPLPNVNLDKSVFTAETMQDAQAIVNKRISENLPPDTQFEAWKVSKESGSLFMQKHGTDEKGNRYTITLGVVEAFYPPNTQQGG